MRIRLIVGFLTGLLTCGSADAATLRVGLFGLSTVGADPYHFVSYPDILTDAAIFDGLTRIDEHGTLQPWLAVSWENVDPLTWIFHLRHDVRFSNGAPFTSRAVVNAVEYLAGPIGQHEEVATELNFLKSAEAISDDTVKIVTKVPSPMLPRYLPVLFMVEPDQWTKLGPEGFAQSPVGTGPFKVTAWRPTMVNLVANRDSWRVPRVDALDIRAVPDATARLQALLSGQIDVAYNIGPDDKQIVEDAGGTFFSWRTSEIRSMSFVTSHPSPLQDARVRRALNVAVDRATIINALLDGATVPASQGASHDTYGYDASLPPFGYHPDEAKHLLAEAGYDKGFSFILEIVSGSSANDNAVVQRIATDLEKVGVKMQIKAVPIQEFVRNVETGKWEADAFMMVYPAAPSVDALRPLRLHSCLWRFPWFCDKSIMPDIEAAFTEFDPAKQITRRHALMAWERDQAPALFLWEEVHFGAMAKGVENFKEISGFINYDQITLTNAGAHP